METENLSTKKDKPKTRWGRVLASAVAFLLLASLFIPFRSEITDIGSNHMRNINKAHQFVIALKMYASDHDGAYPAELNTLVRENILSADEFERSQIRLGGGKSDAGWIYIRGLHDASPSDRVLIVSPPLQNTLSSAEKSGNEYIHDLVRPAQEMRIVAKNDGVVKKMSEAKFQEVLMKTGQTLPEPPPTKGK